MVNGEMEGKARAEPDFRVGLQRQMFRSAMNWSKSLSESPQSGEMTIKICG